MFLSFTFVQKFTFSRLINKNAPLTLDLIRPNVSGDQITIYYPISYNDVMTDKAYKHDTNNTKIIRSVSQLHELIIHLYQ